MAENLAVRLPLVPLVPGQLIYLPYSTERNLGQWTNRPKDRDEMDCWRCRGVGLFQQQNGHPTKFSPPRILRTEGVGVRKND